MEKKIHGPSIPVRDVLLLFPAGSKFKAVGTWRREANGAAYAAMEVRLRVIMPCDHAWRGYRILASSYMPVSYGAGEWVDYDSETWWWGTADNPGPGAMAATREINNWIDNWEMSLEEDGALIERDILGDMYIAYSSRTILDVLEEEDTEEDAVGGLISLHKGRRW